MSSSIQSAEVSAKEFGALQANVEHIKEDVIEIKDIVRNQDSVSRQEYQKLADFVEQQSGRLNTIEKNLGINEATFTGQVKRFMDKNVAAAFSSALILIVIWALYVTQSSQIERLKTDLNITNETVRSRENK
mgnify:CR=1 FL=1